MSTLWHLALECSSTGGSVALLEIAANSPEPRLRSQIVLPEERGSVCSLSPSIEGILRDASLTVGDLESLSVTAGPGSFTGLRVGLSTAKMLAMACQKVVVPVDTLAAIAARFFREHVRKLGKPVRLVTPLNAFRKQVFTASWFIDSAGILCMRSACVVDAEQWLANPWGAQTSAAPDRAPMANSPEPSELWISGPGLAGYTPSPSALLQVAPQELWQPLAEDVGRLGWQAYRQGQAVSAAELSPNYIRESAAEEKRRAAGKG